MEAVAELCTKYNFSIRTKEIAWKLIDVAISNCGTGFMSSSEVMRIVIGTSISLACKIDDIYAYPVSQVMQDTGVQKAEYINEFERFLLVRLNFRMNLTTLSDLILSILTEL